MAVAPKFWICIVALLTGCATKPTSAPRLARGELPPSMRLCQGTALPVRIGVEHVEVVPRRAFADEIADREGASVAEASSTAAASPARAAAPRRGEEPKPAKPSGKEKEGRERREDGKTAMGLDPNEPVERFVDRFLNEFMGYDERHEPRSFDQIGMFHHLRNMTFQDYALSDSEVEERNRLLDRWQNRLINKPLTRALRAVPVVQELEESLNIFKSDNVPLSDPYYETHRSRPNLGRFALRVRPPTHDDYVEVVYVREGWRIGAGPDSCKLGHTLELAEDLSLHLRSKYGYDAGKWELDSTLVWHIAPRHRANLLLSNHLDLLTEPMTSPVSSTQPDLSNGLLFYFEHLF